MDKLLQSVLEQTGLPVKQYEYRGSKSAYIVFNEESEREADYGDDKPNETLLQWQVHLFMPESDGYREKKREIKKLLWEAGFGIAYTETLYEKETGTAHVVISCNGAEGVD